MVKIYIYSSTPWRICAQILGPHEVGHEDVATGCGVLSLQSYTRKTSFENLWHQPEALPLLSDSCFLYIEKPPNIIL